MIATVLVAKNIYRFFPNIYTRGERYQRNIKFIRRKKTDNAIAKKRKTNRQTDKQ